MWRVVLGADVGHVGCWTEDRNIPLGHNVKYLTLAWRGMMEFERLVGSN